jgi:hypothetical protein
VVVGVVVLYAAGLFLVGRWLYVLNRWREIDRRSIVTCAEFVRMDAAA